MWSLEDLRKGVCDEAELLKASTLSKNEPRLCPFVHTSQTQGEVKCATMKKMAYFATSELDQTFLSCPGRQVVSLFSDS